MNRPRRTREQLRIVNRDRADSRVRDNDGLIHSTLARQFPWAPILQVTDPDRYDLLHADCMIELMKADRDYRPELGAFSTVATKYIINAVLKHEKKRMTESGRTRPLRESMQCGHMNPAEFAERNDQARDAEWWKEMRLLLDELEWKGFKRRAAGLRRQALRIRESQMVVIES